MDAETGRSDELMIQIGCDSRKMDAETRRSGKLMGPKLMIQIGCDSRKMGAETRRSDEVMKSDEDRQKEEKFKVYIEQMRKTEGYEITIGPCVPIFRGVVRMDLSKERRFQDFDMCAQLAIDKYNSIYKEQPGLEFVKVLTVTARVSCFMTFYITFEAKDLAEGGLVKIYQTEMLLGIQENDWTVKAIRLRPDLDEQGCYIKGDWLWKEGPVGNPNC